MPPTSCSRTAESAEWGQRGDRARGRRDRDAVPALPIQGPPRAPVPRECASSVGPMASSRQRPKGEAPAPRSACSPSSTSSTNGSTATTSRPARSSMSCSKWALRTQQGDECGLSRPHPVDRPVLRRRRGPARHRVVRALVAHPHEGLDRLGGRWVTSRLRGAARRWQRLLIDQYR
jgi:hypothetical protein